MISENIKKAREKAGLSQRELGRRINKTGQYISYLEKTIKSNPSISVLKDISNALNISVDELLKDELQESRIQFIKEYSAKYPDDKKISNIVKKINAGEPLSDEDIQSIDGYKKADIVARDFDAYDVPCVRGPEHESFELFKKLLKSLGYTNNDLGSSDIVLFARIKAQIELEIKMAKQNKEGMNGNI